MIPFCWHEGAGLKKILGFPQADPNLFYWLEGESEYLYVHFARTGIQLTRDLLDLDPGAEILVPSYNCGAELDALINSGLSVSFFRTNIDGSIDLDDLCKKITGQTRAIYLIHYFGFPQDAEAVLKICKENKLFLLEDCALSLLSKDSSGRKLGTYGDISFFSFVKFLPVPDGGLLAINNPALKGKAFHLEPPRLKNVFKKILPLLKSQVLLSFSKSNIAYPVYDLLFNALIHRKRTDSEQELLDLNGRPEMLPYQYFNDDFKFKKISVLSWRVLSTFDIDEIIRRRRRNFVSLLDRLSGTAGIQPLFDNLPEGVCPLAFPLITENRDTVAAQLNANAIDAITWWRAYNPAFSWEAFPEARFLKDNVITLPVHSDLDDKAIAYMADTLNALLKSAPQEH